MIYYNIIYYAEVGVQRREVPAGRRVPEVPLVEVPEAVQVLIK